MVDLEMKTLAISKKKKKKKKNECGIINSLSEANMNNCEICAKAKINQSIYIYIKIETSLCESLSFCQVAPPMKFLYNHPTLPLIA